MSEEIETKEEPSRGEVCYSKEYDLLILSLGGCRAVYIRGDGTLVPQGTQQPIPDGSVVNVMDNSQALLAAIVRTVRENLEGKYIAS